MLMCQQRKRKLALSPSACTVSSVIFTFPPRSHMRFPPRRHLSRLRALLSIMSCLHTLNLLYSQSII